MPETANLRWMHDADVESAHPVLVIRDTPELIALFEPGGAVGMHTTRERVGPRGRNIAPGTEHTGFREVPWRGEGVLRVHRPGQPWSTWRWLDASGTWSPNWYVNLEQPWLRTASGFDSEDWILDIVLDGDLGWRYKDEDEFEWAQEVGRFDAHDVETIRDAARRAIGAIESRAWPFGADWKEWLPPADATIPTLLDDWDRQR